MVSVAGRDGLELVGLVGGPSAADQARSKRNREDAVKGKGSAREAAAGEFELVETADADGDTGRRSGRGSKARDDFLRRLASIPAGKSLAYRIAAGETARTVYGRFRLWLKKGGQAKQFATHCSADRRSVYITKRAKPTK